MASPLRECIAINRSLYKQLEEAALFPRVMTSRSKCPLPALDEPLKMFRQYKKNTGRLVEVLLNDGVKVDGKLLEVQEHEIVIEETRGKNKKKEIKTHRFPFDAIKSTKIQIVF
jgi:ribosome maturation factor RimP